MEKNIFKNSYDGALLSYSVLKRLKSGNVDSFAERLRSQKIHYFAQLFGVVSRYPYNLYMRGPYSPDLAYDLYQIKNNHIKVDIIKFVPEELEKKFEGLREFIKEKRNRQLEVIATFHWLMKEAKLSKADAEKKLIELKSTSKEETDYAFDSLKKLYESIKTN